MNPFLSPADGHEGHSRLGKCGLLKAILKPLRKLLRHERDRQNNGKEDWTGTADKEIERTGDESLPVDSDTIGDMVIAASKRRATLRKERHDSQQSPLSSIPEQENGGEMIEHLSHVRLSPPAQATLLGLPPELRNIIYQKVFHDWQSCQPLQFLQTCRQVHAEAADLAFSSSLFTIHSEHWADADFFDARYASQLAPSRIENVRHLALRLPRGAPYDCYNSRRLHANLPGVGFQLSSLIIFSHYPRPLPRTSDYGGVMEMDLCSWLIETLYSMDSLTDLRILNYESASPGLFDIPSPRLVRLLRGQIFRDVIVERQSLSEDEFQWHCHCEKERAYSVYSAKLGRTVNISFENGEDMDRYGLGYIHELQNHLNPEELLRSPPPDMSQTSYAILLAQKNSNRKRLSKTLSMRQNRNSRPGSNSIDPTTEVRSPTPANGAPRRRRLSKRYSHQSQHAPINQQTREAEESEQQQRRQHRESWHAAATMGATPQ
ncbi:hypothetical protein EJ08DRAFT_655680 [Tothia fuscella]|uniref:Uncharacterized protein n=1 Tax=Tothia fuscella TaxID=1048955 RepID=A0A9P4P399_9PEZI|nr:hypothetical protein EJ08DRAFT_655680 [Tothia fuscella]